MGIIFSCFQRKKSTIEVLQKIEDDLVAIEEYKTGARRRQQRLTAVIVAYSVVLYLIAGLLFYYHYFPDDMTTRLLCVGTLLLFPAVVYLLKRLLMWYYGRKISKNELKSASLKKKKETILEEVQDKETYKVAKQILEKFAPEQLRRSPLRTAGTPVTPAQQSSLSVVRQRQLASNATASRTPVPATPLGRATPLQPGSGRFANQVMQSPMPGVPGRMLQPPTTTVGPRAGPPLPRPVLPRERGLMDRMLDYLVGDGPANRYALICRQCQGHNGMALKEEFEYLAFRCSYCYAWNPARKQRPSAPRLPAAPTSGESMVESDTTETSESETEAERVGVGPASQADRPASRSGELPSGPGGRADAAADHTGTADTPERPVDTATDQPGGPAAGHPEPHVPAVEPDVPAAEPDVPAAGPDVPAAEPDVPAAEPDVPAAEPDVPAAEPDVPAAEPDVLMAEPDVPAAEQSVFLENPSLSQRADDQIQDISRSECAVPALGATRDVPFADDSGADA